MSPLKSKVYPLSRPETQAMEINIEEALASGYIRPSTSPAAAGFFFCWKEGWQSSSLYRLSKTQQCHIQIQVSSAFSPINLRIATWGPDLHQLDLQSAYNLIQNREGDEWKTAFLTTRGRYEYLVMPFALTNLPAFISFRLSLMRFSVTYWSNV